MSKACAQKDWLESDKVNILEDGVRRLYITGSDTTARGFEICRRRNTH